jgi:hypothetical protein
MRRDSGNVRGHYGSTGRVKDQARNGSLTAGNGTKSTSRGGAMIQAFRSCQALPRQARKQFPPTYRSKASAEVFSGIGIKGRMNEPLEKREGSILFAL